MERWSLSLCSPSQSLLASLGSDFLGEFLPPQPVTTTWGSQCATTSWVLGCIILYLGAKIQPKGCEERIPKRRHRHRGCRKRHLANVFMQRCVAESIMGCLAFFPLLRKWSAITVFACPPDSLMCSSSDIQCNGVFWEIMKSSWALEVFLDPRAARRQSPIQVRMLSLRTKPSTTWFSDFSTSRTVGNKFILENVRHNRKDELM